MIRCETDSEIWTTLVAAKDRLSAEQFSRIMSDDPPPAAGILMVPQAEALWQAVLGKCEELIPGSMPGLHGGSRSAGAYGSDGRSCEATLNRGNEDGTSTVWRVVAYSGPYGRKLDAVMVQVHGPWLDNHDQHWERLLREDKRHVVSGHGWYSFGSGGNGGFGGQLFRWRDLVSGEVTEWNDMWFAGAVPPAWRERIPDTHEMLEGFAPRFIA